MNYKTNLQDNNFIVNHYPVIFRSSGASKSICDNNGVTRNTSKKINHVVLALSQR